MNTSSKHFCKILLLLSLLPSHCLQSLSLTNLLSDRFLWRRICLRRPWTWAPLPGVWVQSQRNHPSPSLHWSQALPLESTNLSNCGNCHVKPKPSFADGSKMHNPGQPTNPKTPPCKSFALAQSFWLGNHLLINEASKMSTGATCLANCKYFTFNLGKLFNTAPSTGLLVTLKFLVS